MMLRVSVWRLIYRERGGGHGDCDLSLTQGRSKEAAWVYMNPFAESLCCRYGVRLSCDIVLGFWVRMAVRWNISAALSSPATLLSIMLQYTVADCRDFLLLSHPPTEPFLALRSLDSSKQVLRNGRCNLRHVAVVVGYTAMPRPRLFPPHSAPPYTRRSTSRMTTRAVSHPTTYTVSALIHFLMFRCDPSTII